VCDTIVSVEGGGSTWFAKNSDRAPGEAQVLEFHPEARHATGAQVCCGATRVPQARLTRAVLLSRPAWMWGSEMGINDRGVAIGNEAVFTRLRVPRAGLTGMDLLRLALERASSAGEALEVITDLLGRYDQGGAMGFGDPRFRYHSSFALADPGEAWVLETAGPFWAAQRVRGTRTLSNALTIGADFDRIHDRAFDYARSRGWCRHARDFDFARCFGDRFYRFMAGGDTRRACTMASMSGHDASVASLAVALRDHGGRLPRDGLRSIAPCAHASWLPTRAMAQTTASLIAHLGDAPAVWATGGSAPCLGVFKPVPFGDQLSASLPKVGQQPDCRSLWWRQHWLHAIVLGDYAERRAAFEAERRDLEERALAIDASDGERCGEIWQEHRKRIPKWTARAARAGRSGLRPFPRYWLAQARRAKDGAGGAAVE